MFAVVFEVQPKPSQRDAYLGYAKMLRPELEQVDGFIDNIRYRTGRYFTMPARAFLPASLTREGWVLSLCNWRDEKSVVRWWTSMRHHEVQELGRGEVMLDYHLRVGELIVDSRLPRGATLLEQRFDETQAGEGTTLTLISATRPQEWSETNNPAACAEGLGIQPLDGFLSWDLFEAILTPGNIMLLISWKARSIAKEFEESAFLPEAARLRSVRVVREYGMFDRREAPQYYPNVEHAGSER
jgi:heme-degrading monooxygenase HmoA